MLLPGLPLFSSTVVLEPLFNLGGRERGLNRIALRVFLTNAFLNLYLVPYEGVLGASAATSLSLAVCFYLFVRGLEGLGRVPMMAYLLSGGIVYTAHQTLDAVRLPVPVMLLIIAVALPLLFSIVGLFEQDAAGR